MAKLKEGSLWPVGYGFKSTRKGSTCRKEKAWEVYLETEISYLGQIYRGELQGSMWYPVLDGAVASLYKKRTEKLIEEFDQVIRSQAKSELPPDKILGKWNNSDEDLTYSFYDNFTAFAGESVSTGLLFYQFEWKENQLMLTLLKAEDLSLVRQFAIVSQTLSKMVLKEADQELVFRRIN